jgi:hypothetical protein
MNESLIPITPRAQSEFEGRTVAPKNLRLKGCHGSLHELGQRDFSKTGLFFINIMKVFSISE